MPGKALELFQETYFEGFPVGKQFHGSGSTVWGLAVQHWGHGWCRSARMLVAQRDTVQFLWASITFKATSSRNCCKLGYVWTCLFHLCTEFIGHSYCQEKWHPQWWTGVKDSIHKSKLNPFGKVNKNNTTKCVRKQPQEFKVLTSWHTFLIIYFLKAFSFCRKVVIRLSLIDKGFVEYGHNSSNSILCQWVPLILTWKGHWMWVSVLHSSDHATSFLMGLLSKELILERTLLYWRAVLSPAV